MATSEPYSSSHPSSEGLALKARLMELEDLFQGTAWHLYQEELVKAKRRLLDLVLATSSTDLRDHYLSIARGIEFLLSDQFSERALQEAGRTFDNPPEPAHPMALDSEGRRQLHNQ